MFSGGITRSPVQSKNKCDTECAGLLKIIISTVHRKTFQLLNRRIVPMNVVWVTILKNLSSGLFLLYRPTWILKALHQKHLPGGFLNFCNSFLEAYLLPT